jgi:hypothetical protein
VIPDEAVEAAAKAIYATEAQPIYDEYKEEFTGHKPWEWLLDKSRESYRDKARAALEAAAPHLLADCWDRAVEAKENMAPLHGNPVNPYRKVQA